MSQIAGRANVVVVTMSRVITVLLALAIFTASCVGDDPGANTPVPDAGTSGSPDGASPDGSSSSGGRCIFGQARFGDPCSFGP